LHVAIIVLQSVPQKFPTFDSPSALASSFSVAQGLEEKQLSSGAHSSPRGQGVLFSQFCAWSSHVIPQKFVLTDGVLDGDKDAAKSDGDDVDDKLGDDVVAGWVDSVSNSSLATLGCSVGDDGCATSSSLPVLGFNVSDGRVDIVTSSLFSPLGCNDVGELDDAVVGGVDCVCTLGCNVVDDVDSGLGACVDCMDGFKDVGDKLLSTVTASYSSVQLGAEKHPSCAAQ
jgi:hypothetical protein